MLLCFIFHMSLGITYSSFLLGCFHAHNFLIWQLHHCARSRCLDIKVTPDTTVYPAPETMCIIKRAGSVCVAVLMPHLICKMQVKCFSGRNICCYGKATTCRANKSMPTAKCYYFKLLNNSKFLGWSTEIYCQNRLNRLSVQNVQSSHIHNIEIKIQQPYIIQKKCMQD